MHHRSGRRQGYHSLEALAECSEIGYRTYIPERKTSSKSGKRRWTDKTAEEYRAHQLNHERVGRAKGKQYQRERSERVERSFAHVCETGGSRRSWLRGFQKVRKRYSMAAAARNLGLVMRVVFGVGKPRVLQDSLTATWKAFGRAAAKRLSHLLQSPSLDRPAMTYTIAA